MTADGSPFAVTGTAQLLTAAEAVAAGVPSALHVADERTWAAMLGCYAASAQLCAAVTTAVVDAYRRHLAGDPCVLGSLFDALGLP